MIVLVSASITAAQIAHSLGTPEYSHYFLLKEFHPALAKFARVEVVDAPEEAAERYRAHRARGEDVVFLSIAPPHEPPLKLECPTVSLFAWEFDTVPPARENGETRAGWPNSLTHINGAIATSQVAVDAVLRAMGPDYPIAAIPPPVWESFRDLGDNTGAPPPLEPRTVSCKCFALDSRWFGYSANGLVRKPDQRALSWISRLKRTGSAIGEIVCALWQGPRIARAPEDRPHAPWARNIDDIELSGVTYLAVLAPDNTHKNWLDIVSAFCWTFRDVEDATLILKLSDNDHDRYQIMLMTMLSLIEPFKCRVLAIFDYITDRDYRALLQGCTFAINASSAERTGLPLMEALSAGKPVLAPRHSALIDYIDESVAFVVDGSDEPTCLPHSGTTKQLIKTCRLNWESLMDALKASYEVRKHEDARYAEMSMNARKRMQEYCNMNAVSAKLHSHLSKVLHQHADAA